MEKENQEKAQFDELLRQLKKVHKLKAVDIAMLIDGNVNVLYDLARPDGLERCGEKTFNRVYNKVKSINIESTNLKADKYDIILSEISDLKKLILKLFDNK